MRLTGYASKNIRPKWLLAPLGCVLAVMALGACGNHSVHHVSLDEQLARASDRERLGLSREANRKLNSSITDTERTIRRLDDLARRNSQKPVSKNEIKDVKKDTEINYDNFATALNAVNNNIYNVRQAIDHKIAVLSSNPSTENTARIADLKRTRDRLGIYYSVAEEARVRVQSRSFDVIDTLLSVAQNALRSGIAGPWGVVASAAIGIFRSLKGHVADKTKPPKRQA